MSDIAKMLTCSSDHLTNAEVQNFERCSEGKSQDNLLGVTLWTSPWGWMFYIGDWKDDPVAKTWLSDGLRGAIEYARAEGCDYIRFDSAYEPIPGVPTYGE